LTAGDDLHIVDRDWFDHWARRDRAEFRIFSGTAGIASEVSVNQRRISGPG